MERKPVEKYNAFAFTLFPQDNQSDASRDAGTVFSDLRRSCLFIVIGLEECPTTKRFHYQGYCWLKEPLSLRKMCMLIPKAHVEVAKESPKINEAYCTKMGTNYFSEGSLNAIQQYWYKEHYGSDKPWQKTEGG